LVGAESAELPVEQILSVAVAHSTASLLTAESVGASNHSSFAATSEAPTTHEHAVRRQSVAAKKAILAKETSTYLPPMEVYKELNTPLGREELDHIIVVKKEAYKDVTTAAMESVVEEMNKHIQIGQFAEIRFTTELALGMDHIVELSHSQSAKV